MKDEWIVSRELMRQLHDASCPVLHDLSCVSNPQAEAGTVTKVLSNDFAVITDDDQKIFNSRALQSFDNMQENRFAAHFDHWLGHIGR